MSQRRTKIQVFETITILAPIKKKQVKVKVDTGAYRSSIDIDLAKELGLTENEIKGKRVIVKSALGKKHRKLVHIRFEMAGVQVETDASLAKRTHLNFSMIIGRRDLHKFKVEPSLENEVHPEAKRILKARKKNKHQSANKT